MSEQKTNESEQSGSSIDNYLDGGSVDPNKAGAEGQSTEKNEPVKKDESEIETVPKGQYAELETKLGTQGEELGTYRKLFEDTAPLLEALNDDPDLAKAILEGKISSQLLEDVVSGKVEKKDAEVVTKAHEEVKKEVGEKKYEAMTPEEVNKLVTDKASELVGAVEKKFSKNLSDMEKMQNYQKSISDFIAETPDFPEYAKRVENLIDSTGLTNIKVAYDAVKGQALQEKYKNEEAKAAAENAKNIASNAGGGASQSTAKVMAGDIFDKMVGGQGNANVL